MAFKKQQKQENLDGKMHFCAAPTSFQKILNKSKVWSRSYAIFQCTIKQCPFFQFLFILENILDKITQDPN